jgi:hypothetical protein
MIAGSVVELAGGHLSTFQLILYVFALGLGLFIVAQTIARSEWRG